MNVKEWLTNELKQLIDGGKYNYYANAEIFYQRLNDIKDNEFEHASLIKMVLVNQSAMEMQTSFCEKICVTITNSIERALLADGIITDLKETKPKLSDRTAKLLEDSRLKLPRANSILNHRNNLATRLLQIYAYNALLDAMGSVLDVPDLAFFKLRRVETHTPLDWKTATFEDIDAYFDGGSCQYLIEDYMAFFNVFMEWSLKQDRFDFLEQSVRDKTGNEVNYLHTNYWNPMPFEKFRPTAELIQYYIHIIKKSKDITFGKLISDFYLDYFAEKNLVFKYQTSKTGKPEYLPNFMLHGGLYAYKE